jgi:peptidoglycan/xylan/chitin deacetylase (PgdA/CDA1 family)
VILGYHLVDGGTALSIDLSGEAFRAQMQSLRSLAQPVSLETAIAGQRETSSTRTRVVVTFDDAYRNFYTHAWPILKELEIPATLFVPVGFIEGDGEPPIDGHELTGPMSWEELTEVSQSGLVSIGSHSWSHPDLRRLGTDEIDRELGASRETLQDRLGVEVESFCYPRGLWSVGTDRLVGKQYRLAVVGGGRRLKAQTTVLTRLPRTPVRRGMGADLSSVLSSAVWVEEWAADLVRRFFR